MRNAKSSDKDTRLNDQDGLYLLIKPTGAQWWRFDYTVELKCKTLSLGVYPAVTLSDARRKAEKARNNVANGVDPSDTRKAAKAAQQLAVENKKRLSSIFNVQMQGVRNVLLCFPDLLGLSVISNF